MQNHLTGRYKIRIPATRQKKAFTALILIEVSGACKKSIAIKQPTPGSSATVLYAPHGKPLGAAMSAVIGVAGGTLTGEDGFLKMAVPAGALTASAALTIQEIENMWQTGTRARRILPEKLVFTKPAELTCHYTYIVKGSYNPEFLFFAYQDREGYFYSATKTRGNQNAQTPTVNTYQLGDWSCYPRYQFRFPGNKIVNDQLPLTEGEQLFIALKAIPRGASSAEI